jgi:ribosomal protein S18 acetylase RimI-like enzyme
VSSTVPASGAIKGVDIARLSHPLSPADMRKLAALDAELVDELGVRFSTERWGEQQFSMMLPGKWQFSRVAYLAESSRMVGYWIASLRSPEHLHTHRMGVERLSRGMGVGKALYSAVMGDASTRRIRILTLSVAESNETALRFYSSVGFTPLVGESLERFVRSKGGGRVGSGRDRLVVGGYRYLVLQLERLGGAT